MRKASDYVPRRATALITAALADTRVVVVNGARQVGKSTLAEVVLRRQVGAVARFLDDPLTQTAAREDPIRFLQHDGLMLIDEVQRVLARVSCSTAGTESFSFGDGLACLPISALWTTPPPT